MTAIGGHIQHLYEDLDLRFRDLKIIFKGLGYADIEAYEKIDGQNLFIGWDFDNDKLKVARNKQNIKDGGLDRYGLSLKFGDRPDVEKLFIEAYDVLSKAMGLIDYNAKVQVFGSMGSVWYPIEIINTKFPNTIHYNKNSIVFHEYSPTLFGFDGEAVSKALPRNMEMLKKAIPIIENSVENWKIYGPKCINLIQIDDKIIDNSCNSIDQIRTRSGLSDGTTIRTHAAHLLQNDMQRFPLVPDRARTLLAKSIVKMIGAPPTKSIIASIDFQARKYAQSMVDEEKYDILPKILKPIENIVNSFSFGLLSTLRSDHIVDHGSEAERIKKEYAKCCDQIRNTNDNKHINLLNEMDPKIGTGIVALEGIVFKYNDKIFKITGSFGPMNRVIAAIKYKDNKRSVNSADIPLSMFMKSG